MNEDGGLRQDLLGRIEARRAAARAWLGANRPRIRRRATLTVLLTSLSAAFTAGPAIGGQTFATSVRDALSLPDDSIVWQALCFLALGVSVAAAVMTQLSRTQDASGQTAAAETAAVELDGLATLLRYGHLPVADAVKLYQQYNAKVAFIDDLGSPVLPPERRR